MLGRIKAFGSMLKETFIKWSDHDPFRDSGTIAYYTIFSLPGLLVIVVNLAGYVFGTEAVTHQISTQISGVTGGEAGRQIEAIIANANTSKGFTISSLVGVATLLFGATGVFYQTQKSINGMWEVKPDPKRKFLKFLKDRLFSFGMILIVGFLMLVSLIVSAALGALSHWVVANLPDIFIVVFKVLNAVVSLAVITVLFAAMYKILPDAEVGWRDVWVGAFLTACFFVLANLGLGYYFDEADPGSTYGAAGSIILIMLWVSYVALILLFGAQFTQVYACRRGKAIKPVEYAVKTDEESKSRPRRRRFYQWRRHPS